MAKQAKVKMDANPTKVPWPTDKWGFTSDLRKAVLKAAARCKGDADKKKLIDATLEVAIEFIEVNFESGTRDRKRMLEKLAHKEAGELEPKKNELKQKTQTKNPAEPALFDLPDDE